MLCRQCRCADVLICGFISCPMEAECGLLPWFCSAPAEGSIEYHVVYGLVLSRPLIGVDAANHVENTSLGHCNCTVWRRTPGALSSWALWPCGPEAVGTPILAELGHSPAAFCALGHGVLWGTVLGAFGSGPVRWGDWHHVSFGHDGLVCKLLGFNYGDGFG